MKRQRLSRLELIRQGALWLLSLTGVQAVALALLSWVLPGFYIDGVWSLLVATLTITLSQVAIWPLAFRLAARISPLLVPLISFAAAGLAIYVIGGLIDWAGGDVIVDSVETGIWIAVTLMMVSTLLAVVFSVQDDVSYVWFVVRPIQQKVRHLPMAATPGVVFVELDGLAAPILSRAVAEGWMPNVARWLKHDNYILTEWETDLSSQTSASQAGLLLGSNAEMPAFRWYDKPLGRLMVSSKLGTVRELEARLSTGQGLLHDHGASRWNLFSGDATDSVGTVSTVGVRNRPGSNSYLAYFANAYALPRTLALFVAEVFRERWQATSQRLRHEEPRIDRTWKYAFVRGATNTLLQEAALFMLVSDVSRGVPSVYATFYGYDEVAHHSGIDRPDAFKTLKTLDRELGILERAIATARRPYHLVVLSDHGQSMGATFRQRFGITLGEYVRSLLDADARVVADTRRTEDWGAVSAALTGAIEDSNDQRSNRLLRRALASRTSANGQIELGPAKTTTEDAVEAAARASDAVVLASGNLGLISFPQWPDRLNYELLVDRYPGLLSGLANHPGIAFVMVNSEQDGGIVISKDGVHYLDHGYAVGADPLGVYGPNAAAHLRRTNGFSNAPDILVMSMYEPVSGEVAAFEELVGSHGGLGGLQSRPFVLHPAALHAGTGPIVGAAALHDVLMTWLPPHDSPATTETTETTETMETTETTETTR